MTFCAFATGLYNMLDFPSAVVPTGFVTKEDDDKLNDESQWPVGTLIKRTSFISALIFFTYDELTTGGNIALKVMREAANKSAGLPLAVQIVALPFHEEDCLAVMEIVEELWEKRNLARKGSFSKLNLAQLP